VIQIKKTYKNINPEMLYDEARDLVQKQGVTVDEAKIQSYSLPSDSSHHLSRGTLTFKTLGNGKECLRIHIMGSSIGETKMMLDIDEELFPREKASALEEDLDFIFGSYEIKR
jgi:hypothetical protein